MSSIKASCPVCGEVALRAADLTLMVSHLATLSYYSFLCPECSCTVRKPAEDQVISLLMSAGVKTKVWDVPPEYLEPHDGWVLTTDDLIDFVIALASTDYLADLAAV